MGKARAKSTGGTLATRPQIEFLQSLLVERKLHADSAARNSWFLGVLGREVCYLDALLAEEASKAIEALLASPAKPNREATGEKETISFKDLPSVESLEGAAALEAKDLLEELQMHEYCLDDEGREVKREEHVKAIKARLGELQREAGEAGLRWGRLAFVEREMEGRETLDKVKLIEAGVSAEQIATAVKQGKPYRMATFKRLEERDAAGRGAG